MFKFDNTIVDIDRVENEFARRIPYADGNRRTEHYSSLKIGVIKEDQRTLETLDPIDLENAQINDYCNPIYYENEFASVNIDDKRLCWKIFDYVNLEV